MRRLAAIVACVLCLGTLFPDIARNEVVKTFDTMLHAHIEHSELTPKLYKRALHLFIDQIDSYHTLFLEEEIEHLVSLSNEQVSEGIDRFHAGEFPHFNAIYKEYLEAYNRRQELISKASLTPNCSELSFHIPRTLKELKARIQEFLKRKMAQEIEKVAYDPADADKLSSYVIEKEFSPIPYGFHEIVLKSCAKSLDPHSAYFTEGEASRLKARYQKELFGTGVEVQETYLGQKVVSLHPDCLAAQKKLLQRGDAVLAVEESAKQITYSVQRNGKLQEITLQKEELLHHDERVTYSTHPFGDGVIATITIPSMYGNGSGPDCVTDVKNALHEIRKTKEIKGMVIDIRDNSGGFVLQAIKLAGLFIAKGVVLVSRYSDGDVQYARDYTGELAYAGPLVVLTSKLTASAAEIFAQALQEYGVALVAGDKRTYGKATMQYQNITAKDAKSYFKVTIGKYYTASGRSIQLEGVKSDIVMHTDCAPYEIGERYLNFPITSDCLDGTHIDTLSALHGGHFPKHPDEAVPHLSPRITEWSKMKLPLMHNSSKRMAANKNYHLFKEYIYKGAKKKFGKSDVHIAEGIALVQDMFFLKTLAQ